jgi:prepilin-type N-terminal cleavage/methylation domain-containing protein
LIRHLRRDAARHDGFTIIELLITMLIMGILVTIVVMTMNISRNKAQQASCKANLRIILDAVTQYQSIHEGAYPPYLQILGDEGYIKTSFKWTCPAGNYGEASGNYQNYYDPATGQTSCPRPDHNP